MTGMSTLVWVSLLVFALPVVSGIIFAALRALAAWRAFRLLRRRVGDALLDTTRRLAQLEERLAECRRGRRAASIGHGAGFSKGLAIAAILAAAAGEPRALAFGIRGIVPRK